MRRYAAPLVALAMTAVSAAAQTSSYVEIEVNRGVGVGCKALRSRWKDTERRLAAGRLEGYVRLKGTVDWSCFVKAGGSAKAVKFEGRAAAGTGESFELVLPAKALEGFDEKRFRREPFDPRYLPVGGSIVVSDTSFSEAGVAAAFRYLSADLSYRDARGMAMGFTRVSKDRVVAHAGPLRAVSSRLFTGLGLDFDIVELSLGGYDRHERGEQRLRTAAFDVGSPAGLAAYYEFFVTGQLRRVAARAGVAKVGRTWLKSDYRESGASASAAIRLGDVLKVKVGGERAGMTLRAEARTTIYDAGGREDSRVQRYGNGSQDVQIAFFSSQSPGKQARRTYRVLLPDVDRETAVRFADFARAATWLPPAGRPDSQRPVARRFALQFTFTPEDLTLLRDAARACLDSEPCQKRFRDYYEDLPRRLREHPYPNMAIGIVPSKVKIMRQFEDPGRTGFDELTPSRMLVPFMPIEAWLIASCFRTLRPRPELGGKPLFDHLLLVGLRDERS